MAAFPPSEFPLNASSAKGQDANLGFATIRAGGSGLVATSFGIAGFGATLSSRTGMYELSFQPFESVDVRPSYHVNQSGVATGIEHCDVWAANIEPGTGTAELYVSRQMYAGASAGPTAYQQPLNLPTGAEVSVALFSSPIPVTDY